MNKRKETARSFFDFEEDIDFDSFIKPYSEFASSLNERLLFIKKKKEKKKVRAYAVTCKDEPDLFFIAFAETEDKAKGDMVKYFKQNFHPSFMKSASLKIYPSIRRKRIPEFDKYSETKKVPVEELLKYGLTIPCSYCGRKEFTYEDLDNHRCFIIEGEGDINIYTQGSIACYDCYSKYFKKS